MFLVDVLQKLSIFSIILSVLLPIAAFILIYTEKTNSGNLDSINDSLGLYLCLIPIVFGILAYRSIGKDEKLVRSMDRLR